MSYVRGKRDDKKKITNKVIRATKVNNESKRKTQIITISVPPEMERKIDELTAKENRTRSELIREAIRRYILEEEWAEIYRYGEQKAVQEGITEDQIEDIIDAQRI